MSQNIPKSKEVFELEEICTFNMDKTLMYFDIVPGKCVYKYQLLHAEVHPLVYNN